jgi:drug/metabolite transporter (DMT)-like permease
MPIGNNAHEAGGGSISPYVLLTLTMLFWGGNTVLARGIAGDVPPMNLAFWRWTVALVVLLPFGLRPMWEQRALYLRHWKIVTLLAVLSVTMFNSLLYHAVQHTPALNAILVTSVIPAATVLTSWLLFRDRIGWRMVTGSLVAFAGVLFIIAKGDPSALFDLSFNRGDLFALASVVVWALYVVLFRKLPRELNPVGFMQTITIIGLVFIVPLYGRELAVGNVLVLTRGAILGIAYVGVFASALAFIFFNKGVAAVGGSRAAQFNYLTPIFGGAMAIVFLGESLEWFHAFGVALIIPGLYLAANRGTRRA